MLFKVDLFKLKAHYCLSAAGAASFEIFVPTILRQIGYSTFTIGVIFTTLPIAAMLATILVSGFADKYKMRRSVFLSALFLIICSVFFMNYLSDTSLKRRNVHLSCSNETVFSSCDSLSSSSDINTVLEKLNRNSTVRCEVNCDSSVELTKEICSSWLMEKYCETENTTKVGDRKIEVKFSGSILAQNIHLKKGDQNSDYGCLVGSIGAVQSMAENETYTPRCYRNTSATCDMKCDNDNLNNLINSFFGIFGYVAFWLILISMTIYVTSFTVASVLTDTICFSLLSGRDHLYGNQRVLGALGFGLFAVLAGYLVDYSSDGTFKDYTLIWYITAGLYIVDFVICARIRVEQDNASNSVAKDVGKILTSGPAIIFTLWCFYMGLTGSIVKNFLYLHLEDLSSASENLWIKTLQGSASLVAAIPGEVPFFMLSGRIIKKLGHIHCMSFILFVMCIRLLAYSVLVRPVWVLPIELSHGITFGLFFSVMTSYANLIALPGTETIAQGLFFSIFGLGQSFGSFIGGMVYEYYKGAMMFRIFSIITATLLPLHIIVRLFIRPLKQKPEQEQPVELNRFLNPGTSEYSRKYFDIY